MEGLGTVSLILRDGTKEMKVMVEETKKGLREAATMAPRTLCQQCNQNLGQGTAQVLRGSGEFFPAMERQHEETRGHFRLPGAARGNQRAWFPSFSENHRNQNHGDITRDMTLSDCAALPSTPP
ncbi:hypothetical protein V6N13_140626 [Hibiscus sabdariffa]